MDGERELPAALPSTSSGSSRGDLVNEVLERRFAAMGARLSLPERPWRGAPRIDVARGGFDIRFVGSGSEVDVEVVDVRPRERHLLLLVRDGDEKSKFLCGHD